MANSPRTESTVPKSAVSFQVASFDSVAPSVAKHKDDIGNVLSLPRAPSGRPSGRSGGSKERTPSKRGNLVTKAGAAVDWLRKKLGRTRSFKDVAKCDAPSVEEAEVFCNEIEASENVVVYKRALVEWLSERSDREEAERAVHKCIYAVAREAWRNFSSKAEGQQAKTPQHVERQLTRDQLQALASEMGKTFELPSICLWSDAGHRPHPMYDHRARRCAAEMSGDVPGDGAAQPRRPSNNNNCYSSASSARQDSTSSKVSSSQHSSPTTSMDAEATAAAAPCAGANYIDALQKWVDALDAEVLAAHVRLCPSALRNASAVSMLLERLRATRAEARRFRSTTLGLYKVATQVTHLLEASVPGSRQRVVMAGKRLQEVLRSTRASLDESLDEMAGSVSSMRPFLVDAFPAKKEPEPQELASLQHVARRDECLPGLTQKA